MGTPTRKKTKTVQSAGQVITSVFWYANGIIMVDYRTKGQTITGVYYAALLRQLQEKIRLHDGREKLRIELFYPRLRLHQSLPWPPSMSGFHLDQYTPYFPGVWLRQTSNHLFPSMPKL